MKYVITSGWWCGSDNRDVFHGDPAIRTAQFHELWYSAINRYTTPEKILLVDSCSPTLPKLNEQDCRLELVRLNLNPGHPTHHVGKLAGCTRAMLLGMEYFLNCDADYYVYVEQDALLYGENIIESCIQQMRMGAMFGSGKGTYQPTQQSLFILRRDYVEHFRRAVYAIVSRDSQISPEHKFQLAASFGNVRLHELLARLAIHSTLWNILHAGILHVTRQYDTLPIGYGRARPIRFSDEHFYFQHGTHAELQSYLARTGFQWS